jgi:hypothetical protein
MDGHPSMLVPVGDGLAMAGVMTEEQKFFFDLKVRMCDRRLELELVFGADYFSLLAELATLPYALGITCVDTAPGWFFSKRARLQGYILLPAV